MSFLNLCSELGYGKRRQSKLTVTVCVIGKRGLSVIIGQISAILSLQKPSAQTLDCCLDAVKRDEAVKQGLILTLETQVHRMMCSSCFNREREKKKKKKSASLLS